MPSVICRPLRTLLETPMTFTNNYLTRNVHELHIIVMLWAIVNVQCPLTSLFMCPCVTDSKRSCGDPGPRSLRSRRRRCRSTCKRTVRRCGVCLEGHMARKTLVSRLSFHVARGSKVKNPVARSSTNSASWRLVLVIQLNIEFVQRGSPCW